MMAKKKTDYAVKRKAGPRFPEMSERNYPSDENLKKYGPKPKVTRGKKSTTPKVKRVKMAKKKVNSKIKYNNSKAKGKKTKKKGLPKRRKVNYRIKH